MKHHSLSKFVAFSAVVCVIQGCASLPSPSSDPVFRHDVSGGVLPWTHENFDSADEKFTFAVFSDLTGDERERVFEIAVAQLSLLRPEFIINVGDLIEGGTEDLGEIEAQWNSFDDRAERATAPIFYVGGNHDLTGAVLRGVWDQRHGRSYYHFIYKKALFLVLDTEDYSPERMQEIFDARNHAIAVADTEGWDAFTQTEYYNMPENEAGNISAEQSQYFQGVIAENADVRWTFLFMHKAAWKRDDVQTFAAIEQALGERPYTVFNGHVHAYEHDVRRGRDYVRLATTGGFQHSKNGRSMDHVTLVTVGERGADIVNLLMDGILDKTGHIPLGGDDVCFELAACSETD
jgi:hypothetical protein